MSPASGLPTAAASRAALARTWADGRTGKKQSSSCAKATRSRSSRADTMPLREFNPVSPGTRFRSVSDFSDITRDRPERSLTTPLKKSGGRDNHGHIAMRRRGGGHKRKYRIIDFKRDKFGVAGRIESVEYDPNRSARIALVQYEDGEKRYILHPRGLQVGDTVMAGPGSDIRIGNSLPLAEIPLGTTVHNVEL